MHEEDVSTAYSVDKILQQEIIDGKPHYLIKWQGFPATQSTWEPIQNLMETIDDVHKWKKQQQPKMKRQNIRKHQERSCQRDMWRDEVREQTEERVMINRQTFKQLPMLETEQSPIYDWKQNISRKLKRNHENITETPKSQHRKLIKNADPEIMSGSIKMEGFRPVGKISKSEIKEVLDCFKWQSKQLCEIQLGNQRKVYMLRSDVERLYPEKLCEYLQHGISRPYGQY